MQRESELLQDAGDGETVLHHLRTVEKLSGIHRPELDLPEVPPGCDNVMRIFSELSSQRGTTGYGPARISFADIEAYARMFAIVFTPWEIGTIIALDQAFMTKYAEQQNAKAK